MTNKSFTIQKATITLIAIIVAVRGVINLRYLLPGIYSIFSPPSIWFLFYLIIGIVLYLMMVSFAWGLFQRYEASRIGLVWLLAVDLLFLLRDMFNLITGGYIDEYGLPSLLIIYIIIDAAFIVILLSNGIKLVIPEPTKANWEAHRRREDRFQQTKSSWKRLGVSGNTILLPVALGSFIVAPWTYLAAYFYYILVLLPKIPRTPKKDL